MKTSANSTTGPGCHGAISNVVYKDITMVDVNTTVSMVMHCTSTSTAHIKKTNTHLPA